MSLNEFSSKVSHEPSTRVEDDGDAAFGAGNYRVFHNDLGEAIAWLMADQEAASPLARQWGTSPRRLITELYRPRHRDKLISG